jgi:glutamate decarboxylase
MKLPFKGQPLQVLINDCANVLKYQVKSGHVHFMNQLSTGIDIISMAGEWLTAAANANMFTYEVAPVFIIMEHVTLKKMRRIIGFQTGDSIMSPGGTIANLYGILMARHKKFPDTKTAGSSCWPSNLCVFTSDQCHYSVKLGCAVSGIGTDNCVAVPTDHGGRMIPAELERLICERLEIGHCPIMVNATAGTTVLGAFDPLSKIADICQKYKLWMHVDVSLVNYFIDKNFPMIENLNFTFF